MNSVFSNMVDEVVPKYGNAAFGLAGDIVNRDGPKYISDVIEYSVKTAGTKLKYLGYEELSLGEEVTLRANVSPGYDIAKTNTTTFKFNFSYNEQEFSVSTGLIYTDEIGITTISGTNYYIRPVWTNGIITVTNEGLLVVVLIRKMKFLSEKFNFIKNGNLTHYDIVYSTSLLVVTLVGDDLDNIYCPVLMYVFAFNGVRKTFKKYFGVDIIVCSSKESKTYKETHNIYGSTGVPNKGIRHKAGVVTNDQVICVPKLASTLDYEPFVYALLYSFDVVPDLSDAYAEVIMGDDRDKELTVTYHMMDRLYLKGTYDISGGLNLIKHHVETVNQFMDPVSIARAKDTGLDINNIEDLLVLLTTNFKSWRNDKRINGDELVNRTLNIFYYLFYDYTVGINRMLSSLQKTEKSGRAVLLPEKVKKQFNKFISMKSVFKLVGGGLNISLMPASTINDNYFLKLTIDVQLQDAADGVKISKAGTMPLDSKMLSKLDVLSSSVTVFAKKSFTPRVRLSPHANFDKSGKFIIDKKALEEVNEIWEHL